MERLKNLESLFVLQLKDLYNAEKQLLEALPAMRKQAASQKLKNTFSEHLGETKDHEIRLTDIAKTLDIDLSGEACEAMEGLINESKSFMEKEADDIVQDAGIIAHAQRIEHYEISAYGTALRFSQILKHDVATDRLMQTLNEEKNADQTLNIIAEEVVNPQAHSNN